MTDALQRLRRLLVGFETGMAGFSLLLLVLLTLGQIIARNFFDTGLPAADSLTRHLVLYVTFFGAALAADGDRHIKIDVVCAWLASPWRGRLFRPLQALGALICLLLFQAALRFWRDEWRYAADYERWQALLNLIIPVGFGLLCLHFLLGLLLGPQRTGSRA
ncbi:MAG TPA: TRAP transporter small permease subunit [Thiohalobacter sp.]|nr:TRAP transporter small permease subunit [Thiohalobacter sp.]